MFLKGIELELSAEGLLKMIFSDGSAWPAIQVFCIFVGMDDFYPQSFTVSGRERFLTEKELHTHPEVLRDANTVVLIIGEKAGPEIVQLVVEVIRKNLILAECFSILLEIGSMPGKTI